MVLQDVGLILSGREISMKKISFEEAMKNLESIVEELEAGNLTLDDSMQKFKEGIELSAFCSKKLDDAEKKISILIEESDGKVKEQSFDPGRNEF